MTALRWAREVIEAGTPGPWATWDGEPRAVLGAPRHAGRPVVADMRGHRADARLIALAVNVLPAAMGLAERAEKLRGFCDRGASTPGVCEFQARADDREMCAGCQFDVALDGFLAALEAERERQR